MGCGGSKHKKCRNCKGGYPPSKTRSFSMNVHHPPISKGDTYHIVALTSSTLGSIKLDPPSMILIGDDSTSISNDVKWSDDVDIDTNEAKALSKVIDHEVPMVGTRRYCMGIDVDEAKAWSKMIEQKIPMVGSKKDCPKTSIATLDDEVESIDVDVLMEGLEGTSFTFDGGSDHLHVVDTPKGMPQDEALVEFDTQEKEDSVLSEVQDHEGISLSRKEFEELSPTNPSNEHMESNEQTQESMLNGDEMVVKVVDVVGPNKGYDHVNVYPNDGIVKLSSKKERVVLYFTSLRGVRKTYEDCFHVKLILKGYKVRVDERDVSMHSGFKKELKERLGEVFKGGLPKVFVGKRYLGGAEEMRQLHEDGLLEKFFRDCESSEDDSGNIFDACDGCGDVRFVPCETCSGSCKIYYEYDQDDGDEYDEFECGFQRCPDCNENGLVRCPFCCD